MALPAGMKSLRIYPPIGIARVGNSDCDDGWFIGPEVPGHFEEPPNGFKDKNGGVKRQAARFRIYATKDDGKVIEVTNSNQYNVSWKIQLKNKKASWYTFMGKTQEGAFKPGYTTLRNPDVQSNCPPDERTLLIVDSGIENLSGLNAGPVTLHGDFYGSKTEPTDIYLGEARTDDKGRLIVLAGRGKSMSIADPNNPYPYIMTDFDSPDWIDDTSDGCITATITSNTDSKTFHVQGNARVIGTTPKFANEIYAPTSLYDVMEDVYERKKRKNMGEGYDVGDVDWHKDIWPLLQRAPLLSWVNGQANGGHGPNSSGNFFEKGWKKSLSDRSAKSEAIRKGVLFRMRLPITNNKYDAARRGQAYRYFMPWLSGDGGRTTNGDPSTFTSVTELQYDRLVKWSQGHFTKRLDTKVTEYTEFEKIHPMEQPAALTKAALEATIGAPLYPGIEMSWNAELSETYDADTPFTIAETVEAGDLTKFLSLPWQSDFYMCRSYWWPSARPDAIVPEDLYNIVSRSVAPAIISKRLNDRVPWERGLHQNYTDEYSDQPLFANTDMAQNWHQLGFIVQRPSEGPGPIFVEVQRGTVHPKKEEINPILHTPTKPGAGQPMVLPKRDSKNQPIMSLESLRTHLQTAMSIELATIPLYLFGMYSIEIPKEYQNDPRYQDPIIGAIRGVVAEEMLHLSLAGNILRAVGGHPVLYDPEYMPYYPMLMPGRVPKLWLNLRKANKANLQTFINVEKREKKGGRPEADEYQTLKQFYDAIKKGLKYLHRKKGHDGLFPPGTARFQFAPGLGYMAKVRDAGGSVVVTNLDSALKAMDIIVFQGEGSPGPYDDPNKLEEDHYDVFMDLQKGDSDWKTYNVVENPVTPDYYKLDPRIYQASLTFDAAYCLLLCTIQRLWNVDKDDSRHKLVLNNMYGIMMGVLAPLAKFLISQPIGTNNQRAAPCFGYYQFQPGSELKQVQDEMTATINAYLAADQETPDQVAATDYGAMLETLLPIQTTINELVDLATFEKLKTAAPINKTKFGGIENRGVKGFAKGG